MYLYIRQMGDEVLHSTTSYGVLRDAAGECEANGKLTLGRVGGSTSQEGEGQGDGGGGKKKDNAKDDQLWCRASRVARPMLNVAHEN